MKVYGNIQNRFMEDMVVDKIEIGMGVTLMNYSDRHAYTIIEIVNEKTVIIQKDKSVRIDNFGMSDAQNYEYEKNSNGLVKTIKLLRDGKWHDGKSIKDTVAVVGVRDEYYDYSF